MHSLLSGNLMDVCPVGAITTRDYRFKSRPWDNPDAADTICTQCSKGCNTTAWIKAKPEWAKGSRLIRFTPRFNPDVNGYWMCDIGRFKYHWIEGDDRLRQPLVRDGDRRQQPAAWHDCDASARDGSRPPDAATDGLRSSSRPTRRTRSCSCSAPGRGARSGTTATSRQLARSRKPQPADTKFKVPAVDAPNVNGARDPRVCPVGAGDERRGGFSALRAEVEAGRVPALYVFDPGPGWIDRRRPWIVERAAGRQAAAAHRTRACC